MTDKLREVDRVMLETLEALCFERTNTPRVSPYDRSNWTGKLNTIRALLTEQPGPGSGNKQPEQDEAGEQRLAFGDAACPDCHGEGNDIHYVCRTCDGSGLVPTSVPPYEERAKAKPVEPDAPQEVEPMKLQREHFASLEAQIAHDDVVEQRDQYKEKLDTLVGLVETADKNTGSAVAAFNRITLRYKDWNKLRSYAEDAGGTK